MTNSVSFQGGFLIKKPKLTVWSEIKANLPKKKAVFNVFNTEQDSFIACKTHYDEQVADLLKSHDTSFKFYPDINLKSRLDPEHTPEAVEIVNAQKRVITTIEELKEYFENTKKALNSKQSKIFKMDHMQQTLTALKLKSDDCDIIYKRGITFIYDKSGRLIAQASQKSPMGFNYVYFYPECKDHSMERWIVYPNGDKKSVSVLNASHFRKIFIQNTESKAEQTKIKS